MYYIFLCIRRHDSCLLYLHNKKPLFQAFMQIKVKLTSSNELDSHSCVQIQIQVLIPEASTR